MTNSELARVVLEEMALYTVKHRKSPTHVYAESGVSVQLVEISGVPAMAFGMTIVPSKMPENANRNFFVTT